MGGATGGVELATGSFQTMRAGNLLLTATPEKNVLSAFDKGTVLYHACGIPATLTGIQPHLEIQSRQCRDSCQRHMHYDFGSLVCPAGPTRFGVRYDWWF